MEKLSVDASLELWQELKNLSECLRHKEELPPDDILDTYIRVDFILDVLLEHEEFYWQTGELTNGT